MEHIASVTPTLATTAQFLDRCQDTATHLGTTQEALARITGLNNLVHQPLAQALQRADRQRALMHDCYKVVHTTLLEESGLSPTDQALHHSQSGRGAGAFLNAPPPPTPTTSWRTTSSRSP